MGAVYAVDSDLYFRVASDPSFGSVANLDRDQMLAIFAERGGDPDRPGKDDPLDCLVWQSARPDEPAWDTPLGHGRPGWHIECAAIALDHLGMTIDVQGGGTDLAFPHHEMSASEAQVLRQAHPFARHYVHSAMVGWQGHKMSKSRGQPRVRVRTPPRGHRSGRYPAGPARAPLPGGLVLDRAGARGGRAAPGAVALGRGGARRVPTPSPCWPGSARRWPTTSARRTPSTRSTAGRWPSSRGRATTLRRPASSVTSPTRCWAFACSSAGRAYFFSSCPPNSLRIALRQLVGEQSRALRLEALVQRCGEHRRGNALLDGGDRRPAALAGVGDATTELVEAGRAVKSRGSQVEQPRADHAAAPPHLGDGRDVEVVLVVLRVAQGGRLGVSVAAAPCPRWRA